MDFKGFAPGTVYGPQDFLCRADRKESADYYRLLRKSNPWEARQVWKYLRACEKIVFQSMPPGTPRFRLLPGVPVMTVPVRSNSTAK